MGYTENFKEENNENLVQFEDDIQLKQLLAEDGINFDDIVAMDEFIFMGEGELQM